MGFVEAVETLTGKAAPAYQRTVTAEPRASPPKRPFKLPEPNRNNDRVYAYLRGRGIGKALIHRCFADGLIYESTRTHRCVFVGKDGDTPKCVLLGNVDNVSLRKAERIGSLRGIAPECTLKGVGCHPTYGRMRPEIIIKRLDILEDIRFCLAFCHEMFEMRTLALEARKEIFRHSIIIGIPPAGHALLDFVAT